MKYHLHAATAIFTMAMTCTAAGQGLDIEPTRRSFRDTTSGDAPRQRPSLSPAQKAALDDAIQTLTAEAADLMALDESTATQPRFSRPHPALRSFDAVAADEVLGRMNGRFTGEDVLDTYVRWHLMWLYEKKPLDDRFTDGRELLQLLRRVEDPPPLGAMRREEYAYEPRELWATYRSLMHGPGPPIVVVGYPPFQKRITGQAALEQMSPRRREQYAEAVAQAQVNRQRAAEIFPKLKRVDFPENVAFNKRLRRAADRLDYMRHVVRQYRGELIYGLLKTGNPDMLDRVGEEIERSLQTKSQTAFDLMSFIYLAAFDGVLARYDLADRARFGKALEQVARQHDSYADYGPPYPRNFADYAFTAIESMQLGDPMWIPDATSTP